MLRPRLCHPVERPRRLKRPEPVHRLGAGPRQKPKPQTGHAPALGQRPQNKKRRITPERREQAAPTGLVDKLHKRLVHHPLLRACAPQHLFQRGGLLERAGGIVGVPQNHPVKTRPVHRPLGDGARPGLRRQHHAFHHGVPRLKRPRVIAKPGLDHRHTFPGKQPGHQIQPLNGARAGQKPRLRHVVNLREPRAHGFGVRLWITERAAPPLRPELRGDLRRAPVEVGTEIQKRLAWSAKPRLGLGKPPPVVCLCHG